MEIKFKITWIGWDGKENTAEVIGVQAAMDFIQRMGRPREVVKLPDGPTWTNKELVGIGPFEWVQNA